MSEIFDKQMDIQEFRGDPEKCPDCDGRVRHLEDESYCVICGLVIDEKPIDHGLDFDCYDNDYGNSRVGKPGRYIDGDMTETQPTDFKK